MTNPKTQEPLSETNTLTLVDTHCHTEYAYCGVDITATDNIAISKTSGLHGLCLTEHVFQLYFEEDDAWSWRWQTDDGMVQKACKMGRGRMPEYREFVQGLRDRHDGFVHLGLELDLRADGSLLLAEEDESGWDLLLGSVHHVHDFDKGRATRAKGEKLFLRDVERLLAHPIQVLAHPFRFLYHAEIKRSLNLYRSVARWLAESGVAAELNFHWNEPDARFIEECLSLGVKIALGTDSHKLEEVGDLSPHLQLLRRIGVRDENLSDVLYRPA